MEQASALAFLSFGLALSFGIGFLIERFVLSQIIRTISGRATAPMPAMKTRTP